MPEINDWQAAPAPGQQSPAPAAPPAGPSAPQDWTTEHMPEAAVPNHEAPSGTDIDRDGMVKMLQSLTDKRATPDQIRSAVAVHGYVLPNETSKVLDNEYTQFLQKNPSGKPNINWSMTDPAPAEKDNVAASAIHGLASGLTGGFDDEASAALNTGVNNLGTLMGLNHSTDSEGDIYNQNLAAARANKDKAYNDHPLAYGAGFIPGAIGMPTKGLALGKDASILAKAGDAAIRGGQAGAISGAGNADGGLASRAQGALVGGTLGVPMGVVAGALASKIAPAVAGVARRVGLAPGAGADTSGLDLLSHLAPQDAANMQSTAAHLDSHGIPYRLVDLVDDKGRRVIGMAANHPDAANIVAQHANAVYSQAPNRIAAQAQALGPGNLPEDVGNMNARQLADHISSQQTAMGPAFRAVAGDTVPITPEVQQVLSTPEGLKALQGAKGFMPDPADRASVDSLIKSVKNPAPTTGADPWAGKTFTMGGRPMAYDTMPPALQKAVQAANPAPAAAAPGSSPLTVDIADKFARIITSPSFKQKGLAAVASQFAKTVRGAAADASPGYADALSQYANISRVGDAATGDGAAAGTDLLTSQPDQFSKGLAATGTARPTVADIDGNEMTLPSPQDAVRMRAQQDVQDAANAGRHMQVATSLTRNPGPMANTDTLIGQPAAANMRAGMQGEVDRVMNTRAIDPRIGSKTAMVQGDSNAMGDISDILHAGVHAATGNPVSAIMRLTSKWLTGQGVRGIDAGRLTRDALSQDPARIQQSIDFLSQKGVPQSTAAHIMNSIGQSYLSSGARIGGRIAGAAAANEKPQQAPNSVRAVMRSN